MSRRKRRNYSKASSQEFHAKKRALERYGLDLSNNDLFEIIKNIKSGYAEHIQKQTNRLKLYKTLVKQTDVYVVYDKSRKTVVTFLTKEMAENNYYLDEINNWAQE